MPSPARTAKHVPVAALMPMIRTRAAVKTVRLAGAGCVERPVMIPVDCSDYTTTTPRASPPRVSE